MGDIQLYGSGVGPASVVFLCKRESDKDKTGILPATLNVQSMERTVRAAAPQEPSFGNVAAEHVRLNGMRAHRGVNFVVNMQSWLSVINSDTAISQPSILEARHCLAPAPYDTGFSLSNAARPCTICYI